MNIFFDGLVRFDARINREKRKVLLLLDNFSGHDNLSCLLNLVATRVKYLLPNTSSNVQPMDDGINFYLKRRYCTLHYQRVQDDEANASSELYSVEQLTAMKRLTDV